MKKAVVIGAGIGGLATAALLAKDGYSVTVLEKNNRPGGRAMLLEENGFKFDMGPSWYLLPEVFDEFFKLFARTTGDFYDLVKLDPSYRIFLQDGSTLDIASDFEKK